MKKLFNLITLLIASMSLMNCTQNLEENAKTWWENYYSENIYEGENPCFRILELTQHDTIYFGGLLFHDNEDNITFDWEDGINIDNYKDAKNIKNNLPSRKEHEEALYNWRHRSYPRISEKELKKYLKYEDYIEFVISSSEEYVFYVDSMVSLSNKNITAILENKDFHKPKYIVYDVAYQITCDKKYKQIVFVWDFEEKEFFTEYDLPWRERDLINMNGWYNDYELMLEQLEKFN